MYLLVAGKFSINLWTAIPQDKQLAGTSLNISMCSKLMKLKATGNSGNFLADKEKNKLILLQPSFQDQILIYL